MSTGFFYFTSPFTRFVIFLLSGCLERVNESLGIRDLSWSQQLLRCAALFRARIPLGTLARFVCIEIAQLGVTVVTASGLDKFIWIYYEVIFRTFFCTSIIFRILFHFETYFVLHLLYFIGFVRWMLYWRACVPMKNGWIGSN